ncbi:alpha/beta hydrolase [Halobacillus mangrovi]|uniref:alpha/beta hydrolase n=1 Tax=Halobacillus mangrovi TaxID=402384 RepID=UPI003D985C2D
MIKLVSEQNLATIVIVHGAFEHAGRYDELAAHFQKDGFSVIYGDLPGQGKSTGKKGHIYKFDEYIKTIGYWITKADESRPIFVLGHSMGAIAVIRAMQTFHPMVDGVILSSPAAGIQNGAGKTLEAFSHIINRVWPTLSVKAPMKPEMVTRNQELIIRDKQDSMILSKVSIRWYREFRKAIKQSFQNIDRFPDVPLLVMQADKDLMVDIEKTKEWFNKVSCKEKCYKQWPGLYHEIFNEPEWNTVYNYTKSFITLHLDKS